MTKDQLRDLAERAGRTFVQGALAGAPVGPLADWSALTSALTAMAVGGGAAVLSAAASWLRSRKS